VHELVHRFLPIMAEMPDQAVVLDLGAGTGATAWALGLAALGLAAAAKRAPSSVEVYAVDASASMLAAAELLWDELLQAWPKIGERVQLRPVTRPWIAPPEAAHGGWVVAGHLFDASEADEEVRQQFRRLLLRVEPERVLIDAPQIKTLALLAAVAGGEQAGWQSRVQNVAPAVWSGPVAGVGNLRRQHLEGAGASAASLQNDPIWEIQRDVVSADLAFGGWAGERLFALGPTGLALDDDQDDAATPRDRFEVLIGAAGSGKSIVLVERIVRTALASLRARRLPRMLVTTRNVPMIDFLQRCLVDRLGRDDIRVQCRRRADGDHLLRWRTSWGEASIRLLNWDKIPTQLFGMSPTGSGDQDAIRVRLRARQAASWAPLRAYPERLRDVDWLAAELRRVIHGQRVRTRDDYLRTSRVGRIKPLPPQIRGPVWQLLMEPGGQTSYTYLWMELVDRYATVLDSGEAIPGTPGEQRFTHGFVDEVQDFTATDLRFLAAMLTDARQLYCVGDAGQAMLLGATFDIPGTLRGRQRDVRTLAYSYRMSRRIAEAVEPLAKAMLDTAPQAAQRWVGVPTGTRSGVLGVRPIVLLHDGSETEQLTDVLGAYTSLFASEGSTITIAEGRSHGDELVATAMQVFPEIRVRPETVARIKGLERTCVIWSTRRRWKLDESAAEFVHTVLTRATSLVIIVFDPMGTDADIIESLRNLRRDRLLFWTAEAESSWIQCVGPNLGTDEKRTALARGNPLAASRHHAGTRQPSASVVGHTSS